MSREFESKFPDIQERLESLETTNYHLINEVRDLRRKCDVCKELRVIELAFKDRCRMGIAEINRSLEEGFELYKQWQTESGIICELARWGKKDDDD